MKKYIISIFLGDAFYHLTINISSFIDAHITILSILKKNIMLIFRCAIAGQMPVNTYNALKYSSANNFKLRVILYYHYTRSQEKLVPNADKEDWLHSAKGDKGQSTHKIFCAADHL